MACRSASSQAHDGRSAADLIDTLASGQILLADRAYDSDALRQSLAARGAWANAKPISRRTDKPAFSAFLYRYRNLVERATSATSSIPRHRRTLRRARR
jgi:transposase